MDAIINNPFRVLGLSPYSSDKEIKKRTSDLLIYSEMGKHIDYETDFSFLGPIDRSPSNILESVKKISDPESKLFYSLLYFEIKDEQDKHAIHFFELKDYKAAIAFLSDCIFENCPIVYSPDKRILEIMDKSNTAIYDQPNYSIKVAQKYTKEGFPLLLCNDYIVSTIASTNLLTILVGSISKGLSKYRIFARSILKEESIHSNIQFGFTLCIDNSALYKDFIFDSSGNFKISLKNLADPLSLKTIYTQTFDKNIFKTSNTFYIKRIDDIFEFWLNDIKIYSGEEVSIYSSFSLLVHGTQTFNLETFSLYNLAPSRRYNSDLVLNDITFSYVKNLSLIYLSQYCSPKALLPGHLLTYCELAGNFFKQDYMNQYAIKVINRPHIDYSKLSDLFVNEFYNSSKNLINYKEEFALIYFYSPFRYLSAEAEEKARAKVLEAPIFQFEEIISKITDKRKNEPLKSIDHAIELAKSSKTFFDWYTAMFSYMDITAKYLGDKVATELLDCAIKNYNLQTVKSSNTINESLSIIKLSAEYAMNQELRDRIVKNLDIITSSNNLPKIHIDFKKKDLDKHISAITYRGNSDKTTDKKKEVIAPVTEKKIEENKKVILQKKSKFDKIPSDVKIIFFLFLLGGVLVTIIKLSKDSSSVNTVDQQSSSIWKNNHLQNGSSPYNNFFGSPIFDYNSQNWILFKNGNNTDAIVCLENIYSNLTIRNVYIQAGSNFRVDNLPNGTYKIKIFYGNDWNPNKTMNEGRIIGAFESDNSFSVSDRKSDLIDVYDDGRTYSTAEITLYKVQNGNMHSRKISSTDFFK